MRLVVVACMVALFVVARMVRARHARVPRAEPGTRLPERLLGPARRTWLVFTSPYCASCGPVAQRLEAADPEASVVTVDATREPELARALSVRSAPTAFLADADGEVRARVVGAAAVDSYVRSPQ
jgi:hypothetical protein